MITQAPKVAKLPQVANLAAETRCRPPRGLTGAAVLVAALALLPLAYLLLRAASASPAAWASLMLPRTLVIIANSALLAATVAAASPSSWAPPIFCRPW